MKVIQFSPIGTISSCYKEKFGIPRQPGLAPAATAELILNADYGEESIRGLAGFSHIWINFVFHETQAQGWKPMVRPPRLGGNTKVGVFASRSTFRPNPIGLSVVELLDVEVNAEQVTLHLAGCDILDGTPVLDIKPYLPYADIIPNARGGFAENKPEALLEVIFSDEAEAQCEQASKRLAKVGGCLSAKPSLNVLITQILQLDPRPSYKKSNESDRIYAMKLYDFDLKWRYDDNNKIKVLALDEES